MPSGRFNPGELSEHGMQLSPDTITIVEDETLKFRCKDRKNDCDDLRGSISRDHEGGV